MECYALYHSIYQSRCSILINTAIRRDLSLGPITTSHLCSKKTDGEQDVQHHVTHVNHHVFAANPHTGVGLHLALFFLLYLIISVFHSLAAYRWLICGQDSQLVVNFKMYTSFGNNINNNLFP